MTNSETLTAAEERAETGALRRLHFPINRLLVFAFFFVTAVLVQLYGGGYRGEFGSTNDEAAHFVTGLMARDYVAAGAPAPPVEYAENYYRHYPKVAIGHFPPGFYVVQGAWNLVFPPSRISILLLMALISAGLATCIFGLVCAEFPYIWGIAAGLIWQTLPFNQIVERTVMSDILVALLALLATLAWSRYLERGRVQDSIQFGLLASVALLTKGTAVALAPMVVFSTLLSGRFRRAGRWTFWLPALMVPVICSPWYLLAPAARQDVPTAAKLAAPDTSKPVYIGIQSLLDNFGAGPMLLIVVGLFVHVVHPLLKRRRIPEIWACLATLSVSLGMVAIWVQAARAFRHTTFAMPALTVFLVAGGVALLSRIPADRLGPAMRTGIVAVSALALVAYNTFTMHPVLPRGFSAAAEEILSYPASARPTILISSDGVGEGALVSEIARRDPARPSRVVLRASRVLAEEGFYGVNYQLRYETTEEMADLLRRIPVDFVIIDNLADADRPHARLLREIFEQSPDSWKRIGGSDNNRGKPNLEVFRQVDVDKLTAPPMPLEEIPGMKAIYRRER